MKFVFALVCSLIALLGFPQSSINGYAKNQEGNIIRLIKYDDYITYKSIEIGRDTIDSSGGFSIKANLQETSFCILQSDVMAGIYIEPDKAYTLKIPPIDTSVNYAAEPIYVNPEFQDSSLKNLNVIIAQFNVDYDQFVSDNLNLFIKKKAKQKVDTFYLNSINKYQVYLENTNDLFFQDYLSYSIANLRAASAYTSKKSIYNNYLASSKISYNNDSYMDFFNQFYKEHFKALPSMYQNEIIEAIKVKMDKNALDDILKRDPYLSNDTIRELVLLKSLKENYRNPNYSRKGVLIILNQLIEEIKNEEHLKIALNIYQKLSSIDAGSFAPDFELFDLEGNARSLSDISKYKFVYLDFWATWCSPCIKEMKLMPQLYKEFGDNIEFVSVSLDKKMKTAQKFVKRNNYDWVFLYLGDNEELLSLYKATVIPAYYLIAPGGKVIASPASRPSDIKAEFSRIQRNVERFR